MFALVRRLLATRPDARPARRAGLGCEPLEDRVTPTASAITSNFNGTAIQAGNYLWFNSVAKVSGVTEPTTVRVSQATITFNAGSTPYTVAVPDSAITLNPTQGAGTATADFGAAGWAVATRAAYSGNVFLDGTGWRVPATLPGGSVKSITWSADFTADKPGVKVSWQWSAAVYTQFDPNPGALAVKPSDTATALYPNSDHAGTPEAFKAFVIGGARGGGGSNFTGSYSSTKSVTPEVVTGPVDQTPATLSGTVRDTSGNTMAGVTLTLSGTNDLNQQVTLTVTTDANGYYLFETLRPGTYTITETPPAAPEGFTYGDTTSNSGTITGGIPMGNANGTAITSITVGFGDVGTDYDFTNSFADLG
jgi:hypothetical protein